jgi:hypothetical protein
MSALSTAECSVLTFLVLLIGRHFCVICCRYVIGGGDGSFGAPTSSIEVSALTEFGYPTTWREMTDNPLPQPVSAAAGVTFGRFLYVLGGHNGTSTSARLMRAHLLSPLETPAVDVQVAVSVNETFFEPGE